MRRAWSRDGQRHLLVQEESVRHYPRKRMLVQATRTKRGVKTWPRLPHKVWILYIVIVRCHSGLRLVPGISSSCRLLSLQESNCGNEPKDPLSQPQQTNGKGGRQRACSEGRSGTQTGPSSKGPSPKCIARSSAGACCPHPQPDYQ